VDVRITTAGGAAIGAAIVAVSYLGGPFISLIRFRELTLV
jgi:hypothetical protein